MKQRLLAALVSALLVAACDSAGPTPRLPTVPDTVPATLSAGHITGTVMEDDGSGVADVAVAVHDGMGQPLVTVLTDASGHYDVSLSGVTGRPSGYLTAAKTGYETNEQYVTGWQQDFRLHRTVSLVPGMVKEVVVTPTDSLCGLASEWRCRTIRITPPKSGTLTLEAVLNHAGEKVGVGVYPPNTCCTSNSSIRVSRDVELRVDVLVPFYISVPHSVTLKTGFTPE